ncbi:MAG: beta-lactamase family protein, partial [Actinobacteria bacterium]|nr:beta-lactamase family protein [Actinomycetota bacterium]
EFELNFQQRGELGAAVCVVHEGEAVVDLFGGSADESGNQSWRKETAVCVYSCTKGATALCAHLLAAAGELDLEAPVARYWPEFGRNGKEMVTVRMLLSHQAGLPGLAQPASLDELLDAEAMAGRLADLRPWWKPGSCHGYHVMTFGWLVGELVRRVGHAGVGSFFAEQVAGPLGLSFWIGLPEIECERVAATVPPPGEVHAMGPDFGAALARGEKIQVAASNSFVAVLEPGVLDSATVRAAELPAIGGIADARSLAAMYAPLSLAEEAPGFGSLSQSEVARINAVNSAAALDAVLLEPTRYGLGFEKGVRGGYGGPEHPNGLRLAEDAFGHSGLGGSLGFADPRSRFSFGFVTNRHPDPAADDIRCQRLIDATYEALGGRAQIDGGW